MTLNKDDWQAAQRQKLFEDEMDRLRRQSRAKTEEALSKIEADIKEYSQQFDENYANFVKVTDERARQYGMESFSTLIMQMRPSLEAYAKMAGSYRAYILSKAYHAIASNVNFQSSPFFILEMTAEAARYVQAKGQEFCGLLDELPEPVIPYLAEVDDKGVLSLSLDVPNTQVSDEFKANFVNDYQTQYETHVRDWINNSRTLEGDEMAVVNTPEGNKIEIRSGGGTVPRYMTKEEFSEFRERVIQPALERHFDASVTAETSRNMRPT